MKSDKELTTPASNVPAHMTSEAWGSDVNLGQDIVIAKILPMQGLSELVADGKARMGEMRDSLTGAMIAGIDQMFEFLPFHVEKFWDVLKETYTKDNKPSGEFKWDHSEPLVENPQDPGYNDHLPWAYEENGLKMKRVRRMNFYGLLVSQIKSGESIPYILSFKSTSFKEGKKLLTQMYLRNRRANLPPCGYVIAIKGMKKENDKGKFIIPTIELGRKAAPEEIQECWNWMQLVKKGAVKVDDSDLTTTETTGVEEVGDF